MHLTVEELKQIQLYRQHITNRSDKLTVCRDLNGLQAQFMVNVYYGIKVRCKEEIKQENFGEDLVKNWTIRGTVHSFSKDDLPLYKFGKERYRNDNFKGYVNRLTEEWMITPDRQINFSALLLKKVAEGVGSREELKKACTENGITELEMEAMFNPWGGGMRELCENGFLCYKVQEKKEFILIPKFEPMEQDEAELEMARRYFTNFAPATIKDTAYYFGWTHTYAKKIMSQLPLEHIQIDDKQYFYLDRLKTDYPEIPHSLMLGGFDQLMLGYQKQESIYLAKEHIRSIFNLTGIVMPPVLINGKVVGRWRKKGSKITFEMFHSITGNDKNKTEDVMERLFDDIKKVDWL